MTDDDPQVRAVIERIDTANAADPTLVDGVPAALLYGRRMTATLAEFEPVASAHLRIACRGQHVERWLHPRSRFPMTKPGYLRWREALKRFHAERVTGFMRDVGFDEPDRARVGRLILKQGLKRDVAVQTLEDVVCLVFVRHEFGAFAATQPPEKVLDIVAKTGRKMSARGRAAVLAMGLPDDLARALGSLVAEDGREQEEGQEQ